MERVCFTFGLHPGKEAEYERRHDRIWLEMLDLLEDAGFHDYSIFLDGSTLYAFLKADPDWESVVETIKDSDVQRRWAQHMGDLIAWQVDEHGDFRQGREVFRFEGSARDRSPVEGNGRSAALEAAFTTTPAESVAPPIRPSSLLGADRNLLAGGVVVVTGAGGEIGRAIASEFASPETAVVLVDTDEASLTEATRVISTKGPVTPLLADVTDPVAVDALRGLVLDEHERVDVVVNNAGVLHADPVLEMPIDEWKRVFDVNVHGTFLVTQAMSRIMIEQTAHTLLNRRGLIMFISSFAADIGRPLVSGYGASKAAVNHFAKTCSVTFRDTDMSSVVVYPNTVRSGLWSKGARRMAEIERRSVEAVERDRVFQSSTDLAQVVVDTSATPGLRLNGHLVLWTRDVVGL